MTKQNWFEVDKAGLAKLMAGRGKAFVIYELLQNAWDQNVARVDVAIEPVPGHSAVRVVVTDDDPDGFADLRDAYTLFAESRKKQNPQQRGRFDIGEKLILALANYASIESTAGGVRFDETGRHTLPSKRPRGSCFTGEFPFSRAEITEITDAVGHVIAPVPTSVNGQLLAQRAPVDEFRSTLPTLVADDHGVLRQRQRETTVRVYEPARGAGWLYEMGIPVVETGDRYDVDIGQKVLLTMDRDNVRPSYLRAVRVVVLGAVHERLEPERVNDTWVREACADERTSPAAIRATLARRFGKGAVAYDPSDADANKLSVAAGRAVVAGRSLTAAEWAQARRAEALPPAGQVTPSPQPFHPDGTPLALLDQKKWTEGIQQIVDYASWFGGRLLGRMVTVRIANDCGWPHVAAYGPQGVLYLNVARLGYRWFERGASIEVNDLLIHEFGHGYCGDHLSSEYHEALTRLGAKAIALALEQPDAFRAAKPVFSTEAD